MGLVYWPSLHTCLIALWPFVLSDPFLSCVCQLSEGRPRLQAWFATIPLDENQKVGISQWVSTLQALNVIGTFTCTQGSDIVGDDRVGTEFKCRLSVPQVKSGFVNAQKESGNAVEDVTLDFDETLGLFRLRFVSFL